MLTVPGRELCFEAVECRKERDRGRDRAGKDLYAAVSGEKRCHDSRSHNTSCQSVCLSLSIHQISKERVQYQSIDFRILPLFLSVFTVTYSRTLKNKTTRYISIHTLPPKCLGSVQFLMYIMSLMLTKTALIWYSNIFKYDYNLK